MLNQALKMIILTADYNSKRILSQKRTKWHRATDSCRETGLPVAIAPIFLLAYLANRAIRRISPMKFD
jgi:hypothetical protein